MKWYCELDKHRVSPMPFYILCCACTLTAQQISSAALSKCPNPPPLSQVLTHFQRCGEPFPQLVTMAVDDTPWVFLQSHICLPRDNTSAKLWCLCGAGTHLLIPPCKAATVFDWIRKKAGRVREGWGCRIGPSAMVSHTYTTQTVPFLGGTGWYFGEILAPRESYKLPTFNRQLLAKCSNIQFTQFAHICSEEARSILTWNLYRDLDRWEPCFST